MGEGSERRSEIDMHAEVDSADLLEVALRAARQAAGGDEGMAEDVHRMRRPSEQVAQRSVLLEALGTLDEVSREVLLMTVLDGLAADEVGARLGLSRDAVYQRVRRAKAALASALPDLGEPDF